MNQFSGKSGKFYVKNPFGIKDYVYAVYPDKECYEYRSILPDYLSEEDAMNDFDESKIKEVYEFTVETPEGNSIHQTSLEGELLEPVEGYSLMKDYLDYLSKKYTYRVNYNFKFEKKCIYTN